MWFDLDSGPLIHQDLDLAVFSSAWAKSSNYRDIVQQIKRGVARGKPGHFVTVAGRHVKGLQADCLTWHLHTVRFIIVCI